MAKVLVMGTNVESQQSMLAQLSVMSGVSQDSVHACQDPAACDVLIVSDQPGLHGTALRMQKERPQMHLWVQDAQGRLRDGADLSLPLLPPQTIASVLAMNSEPRRSAQVIPMPMSAEAMARRKAIQGALEEGGAENVADGPVFPGGALHRSVAATMEKAPSSSATAQRIHNITRSLRQGIRDRDGFSLLQANGQLLMAIDYENAQAVVPTSQGQRGLTEVAQWLGAFLQDIHMESITAEQYAWYAAQGQRVPLRALLWQCAQGTDEWDALNRQLASGALIKLESWPDFRVLAKQQDIFRLCSLLVRRPSSQADCMFLLDLRQDMVQAFVHSAFLAGYVSLETAPAAAESIRLSHDETVAATNAGGLLARMWRSVRAAARGN